MGEPEDKSAPATVCLVLSTEEDWWKGWRLDEPADDLLARFEDGTDDWWAGWHAALVRETSG